MLSKLNQIPNLSVLVVGDIMLDAYLFGEIERMSPEAPVPVVSLTSKNERIGGAGNVACNAISLGSKAYIATAIGDDQSGKNLLNLLKERGVGVEACVIEKERATTIKTRIISNKEHMLRVDNETTESILDSTTDIIINRCTDLLEKASIDVIIIEDYDKGVINERLFRFLKEEALKRNIPLAVDPKFKNFNIYKGVDLFKPNLKELQEGLNTPIASENHLSLENAVDTLHSELKPKISLTTLGSDGMWIHGPEKDVNHHHTPGVARNIVDVSGAGDTVITVAALMLAVGASPQEIAKVANIAGGLVCEKSGVEEINMELLIKELE